MRYSLIALVLVAAWLPTAAAADFYGYETEEGTVAYTDEIERVPARYRDGAERLQERGLDEYARTTPVPGGASYAPSEPWRLPPGAADRPSTGAPSGHRMSVNLGSATSISVPPGAGPIRVSRTGFWEDGVYRTALIVEQGGETLAVIDLSGATSEAREYSRD
jgi:hypothetical protein